MDDKKVDATIPDFEEQILEAAREAAKELLPRELTAAEEKEFREGSALYEMTQTLGFAVLKQKYEDMAYHSWIDPREIDTPTGISKQEWEWRELNAFHAANNAKEILNWIESLVSRYEYLSKVKSGEIRVKPFKI